MSGNFEVQSWSGVVGCLRAACLEFDPELAAHQDRVAAVAVMLAERLGLPGERIERIRLAASLHDVGKLGISREVLHRNGRLTPEELARVRMHPEIGHRILSGAEDPELRLAAEVALRHHESWDGGGYPGGLAGKVIPLEARLVTIADVFDAMRSARAYKEAWTEERVVAEMKRERGIRYDPDLFDTVFAAIVTR